MHWHRSAHVKLMSHDNKYFNTDELQFNDEAFPVHSMDRLCCSPSKTRIETSIISWAQGNCQGFRAEFARELSRYVHLTSYGTCLQNSAQPKGLSRYETKLNVMSQHKFCLAVENVMDLEDWVTEKVYHGLIAGCVPVYWGAPNIEEYLPCKNCVIHVRDFGSVKELADYLIYLDKNPEEYEKYLEYKREPMELKPMLQASKRFSFCAACKILSEAKKTGKKPTKLIYSLNQSKFVPWEEEKHA
uniref:Fucosyltransferase n=1 Tax=Arcella intermedia TaxID=1963864 RepID=A0A6B2LFR0_9EUKA